MKKNFLASLIAAIFDSPVVSRGVKTRDSAMAFAYRMGAGYAGDVNRTHPVSIEPNLIDEDDGIGATFGLPVVVTATGSVRHLKASDSSLTTVWGVTVRPYPTQQASGGMSSSFGAAVPPTSGPCDVMRAGYMTVNLPAGTGAAKKGGAVFVWIAASSGNHVQGGFEDAADGGNTIALDTKVYQFNNTPDYDGNVEISVNV